jgi:TPR repeat protein
VATVARRRGLLALWIGLTACAVEETPPVTEPPVAPPQAPAEASLSEPEQALRQLEADCDAGDGRACLVLAGTAPPDGQAADRTSYLAKACESGTLSSREGCVRLAQTLAPHDTAGSLRAYAAACRENDIESCLQVAETYERGELVERDLELAGRYFEAGCRMKSRHGCNRLVELVLAGEFESSAFADRYDMLDWVCEIGSGIACHEQAMVFVHGADGFEPDPELANKLLERSCRYGSARGCYLFARELEREPYATRETQRLEQLYEDACEEGIREACAGAKRMAKEEQRKLDEGLLHRKLKLDTICEYPPPFG